MVSQQDRAFMTSFMGILAVLVVIAFVFYGIANLATGIGGDAGPDTRMEERILKNIAPMASVNVGTMAPADTAPRAARSGKDVYGAACMACHSSGVAGAPKVGDNAAWIPRAAKGVDGLLKTAISGINAMPPMGTCADCSDEELTNAIVHMLDESGIATGGAAKAAPAPAQATAAPTSSGKGKEIYQASCFACHGTGAAGAPKVGDKETWAPRLSKGVDGLLKTAISGINAMPPKGACMSCSDDDLKAAVEYMVTESQ